MTVPDSLQASSSLPLTPRPTRGEPASLVVPRLEFQDEFASVGIIAGGSAMVACTTPSFPGHALVYYEGNVYNASNIQTFEDRAMLAYYRLADRAPTTAMMLVDERKLALVGSVIGSAVQSDEASPDLAAWKALDERLTPAASRRPRP